MESNEELALASKTAYESLNDVQKVICDKCVEKKRGWLRLDMGDGKSRTSLSIGLRNGRKTLVVAPNGLIVNYLKEIEKVLGTTKYVTLIDIKSAKKLLSWNPKTSKNPYDIVIVSLSTLAAYYKKVSPNHKDVIGYTILEDWRRAVTYNTTEKPISEISLSGVESIYSMLWDTLIMDEFCDYLNIASDRTDSLREGEFHIYPK